METGHSHRAPGGRDRGRGRGRACSRSRTSPRATAGGEIRDEARAVFPNTEVPRDFDTIDIPLPEKGEPELIRWDPKRTAPTRSPSPPSSREPDGRRHRRRRGVLRGRAARRRSSAGAKNVVHEKTVTVQSRVAPTDHRRRRGAASRSPTSSACRSRSRSIASTRPASTPTSRAAASWGSSSPTTGRSSTRPRRAASRSRRARRCDLDGPAHLIRFRRPRCYRRCSSFNPVL